MPVNPAVRSAAKSRAKALRDDPRALIAEARTHIKTDPFRAFELCRAAPKAVAQMTRADIRAFIPALNDWCTTDCFAGFISGVAWREGALTDREILTWTTSENRWLRRAALASTVPLNLNARGATKPKGEAAKTLMMCTPLIDDRDDMVVKAMSWALRELARKDPSAVRNFVTKHRARLAPRVLREVANKLTTGLKNPKVKP